MMKALIFLILFVSTFLFPAQFEIVKDVTERLGDLSVQKYPKKDVNGDWCALLKVFTDIKDLQFKGNGYENHDYRDGIYYVYMFNESKNLTFIKDGYTTKPHNFPISLKSNVVYGLEIKGIGEEKKLEDITINLIGTPENSTIFLDGVEKGKVKSIMTSVGKHELKVTRDGYHTYTTTIEVSPRNTMFNYKLDKVEDALIEINSNPPGAVVYIDGVRIGETPVPGFYPAGTYKIKLVHSDDYEDIEETIVIKSPETKKTYQLTDIRATLTINTHEKAKVFINGQEVSNYKNIKLPPQLVTVRVEMNKAKPLEEKIILAKKDNKTLDMHPEISTGTVQVAVIPSDAEIELWEEGGEKYTTTGSKVFSNVPVGEYKLKVSKEGFKTHTEVIKLNFDDIEKRGIKLEEGSDEIEYAEEDEIFDFFAIEEKPEMMSGYAEKIRDYVSKNYPPLAKKSGVSGSVIVKFVCSKDGVPSRITVLLEKPKDMGFGDVAIKAMEQARFKAGMHRDKPVPVRMSQRITFNTEK